MNSTYRLIAVIVAAAGIAALLLVFWRQQSELTRLREAYTQLASQKASLTQPAMDNHPATRTEIESSRTPSRVTANQPTSSSQSEASAPDDPNISESIPKGKGIKPWQKERLTTAKDGQPLAPNRLVVSNISVKPVSDGLEANMNFNTADKTTPQEQFALVVRLPRISDARIVRLEPADAALYSNVQQRVSENGKFAIFMGTATTGTGISFNLTLSGAETADVRGSCGIKPFLLKVDASGAEIKDFPPR